MFFNLFSTAPLFSWESVDILFSFSASLSTSILFSTKREWRRRRAGFLTSDTATCVWRAPVCEAAYSPVSTFTTNPSERQIESTIWHRFAKRPWDSVVIQRHTCTSTQMYGSSAHKIHPNQCDYEQSQWLRSTTCTADSRYLLLDWSQYFFPYSFLWQPPYLPAPTVPQIARLEFLLFLILNYQTSARS